MQVVGEGGKAPVPELQEAVTSEGFGFRGLGFRGLERFGGLGGRVPTRKISRPAPAVIPGHVPAVAWMVPQCDCVGRSASTLPAQATAPNLRPSSL